MESYASNTAVGSVIIEGHAFIYQKNLVFYPNYFNNTMHTCSRWLSTLLCAPHMLIDVPPWYKQSRPLK